VIVRLLSYNIRFGGVGREAAIASVIKEAQADVVLFQEATRPDVVARIAAATGMKTWASTSGHSVAFMSRLDIAHHAWHRPRPCRRALLELVLEGSETRLFGVHLSAVHSNWTERLRMRELQAMLAAIERHRAGFHVLAGDFNTLAPGETLDMRRLPARLRLVAWLSGRTIRWQTIQIMLDAGYRDGFRSLHRSAEGHTFPTWDPHLRLDYVFVPEGTAQRLEHCDVVGGKTAASASDHFPLLAVVEI
jgi:exodeoxyribonuclease-3